MTTCVILNVRNDVALTPEFLSQHVMLGCAPTGGLYHKVTPPDDVVALIHAAVLKFNICNIDTAPWYGCGKSELDVGRALELLPDAVRDTVHLSSKVGRIVLPRTYFDPQGHHNNNNAQRSFGIEPEVLRRRHMTSLTQDTCYHLHDETRDSVCVHCCSAEGISESCRQTKQRLGAKASGCLKTLRLHDADTDELIQEAVACGGLERLLSLSTGGIAPSLGLNDASVAQRYLALTMGMSVPHKLSSCPLRSVMIAGCWNLLDQSGLRLLIDCQRMGVDVHLAGVFGGGYLWGGKYYRYEETTDDVDDDTTRLRQRRNAWSNLADAYGASLQSVALQFAMFPSCVTLVAIGCSNVQELEANMTMRFLPPQAFHSLLTTAVKKQLLGKDVAEALGLRYDSVITSTCCGH